MAEKEPKENNDTANAANNYAKYTGVVFQMLATIGIFAFIGIELDKWMNNATQWATALSCLIGVCLSIFLVIKQLKK